MWIWGGNMEEGHLDQGEGKSCRIPFQNPFEAETLRGGRSQVRVYLTQSGLNRECRGKAVVLVVGFLRQMGHWGGWRNQQKQGLGLARSRSCAHHVTTLADAFTVATVEVEHRKQVSSHVNQACDLVQPRCFEHSLPAQFSAILKNEHVRHTLKPKLSCVLGFAPLFLLQPFVSARMLPALHPRAGEAFWKGVVCQAGT